MEITRVHIQRSSQFLTKLDVTGRGLLLAGQLSSRLATATATVTPRLNEALGSLLYFFVRAASVIRGDPLRDLPSTYDSLDALSACKSRSQDKCSDEGLTDRTQCSGH